MPDVVLFARKVQNALEAEQARRRRFRQVFDGNREA